MHPPHASSCRRWEAGSKEGAGTQERPDPAQPFHALKSKHFARLGPGEGRGIYSLQPHQAWHLQPLLQEEKEKLGAGRRKLTLAKNSKFKDVEGELCSLPTPAPPAGSSADYKPLKRGCKAEGGGFGTAFPEPEAPQLDGSAVRRQVHEERRSCRGQNPFTVGTEERAGGGLGKRIEGKAALDFGEIPILAQGCPRDTSPLVASSPFQPGHRTDEESPASPASETTTHKAGI